MRRSGTWTERESPEPFAHDHFARRHPGALEQVLGLAIAGSANDSITVPPAARVGGDAMAIISSPKPTRPPASTNT